MPCGQRNCGAFGSDTNRVAIDPGTSSRARSQAPHSVGGSRGRPSLLAGLADELDVLNPDKLYELGLRLEKSLGPRQLLTYFEQVDGLARRLARDAASGVITYGTEAAQSVGKLAETAMKAAEAFLQGLQEGWKEVLSKEDYARLSDKLGKANLITAIFPGIFAAGAVVGILEDVVELIKSLYFLVTNLPEIAGLIKELIQEIFQNPEIAGVFGKEIGKQLASDVKGLSNHGLVRFIFELGRLVGPTLFWTVLSVYFGVGLGRLTLTGAKKLVDLLKKYPRVAKVLEKLQKVVRGTGKTRLHGKPDATEPLALAREIIQQERFAKRADIEDVFYPEAAKELFQVPKGKKWADLVAKKQDGSWALGEGKGTDLGKAVQQLEDTSKWIRDKGGKVSELEVTAPPPKLAHGIRGWGGTHRADTQGFLEHFDVTQNGGDGAWVKVKVHGLPVKVNVHPRD